MPTAWPQIPFAEWRETCAALHLYAQILGKYRLAHTPWQNHSWHATLYLTACGLSTSPVPDGPGAIDSGSISSTIPSSVAPRTDARPDSRSDPVRLPTSTAGPWSSSAGSAARPILDPNPNEIPGAVPFPEDRTPRPYDAGAVQRFFGALVQVDRLLKEFRTSFLGKASPVHLFWGSFDLAVTRFSGRPAPRHPGGVPGLPDAVTREAYSHEVSSAGFWPGGQGIDAAFYSYAYPAPEGFGQTKVHPAEAAFDTKLGEFILPYEAVRSARDPDVVLREFLFSTYDAAATLGHWDRAALECPPGRPRQPRQV